MNKVTPLAFLLFPVFLVTIPLWLLIWAVKSFASHASPGYFIAGMIVLCIDTLGGLYLITGPGPNHVTLPFPAVVFVGMNILGCLVWALWTFVWIPFYWNMVGGTS